MKGSYVEDLANHNGPESCGAAREGGVEALAGGRTGQVLSREIRDLLRKRQVLRDAHAVEECGGATLGTPPARGVPGSRVVKDYVHVRKHLVRELGDPTSVCGGENCRPCREVKGRTPMTNGPGKSDRFIKPVESPNNAEGPAAEAMEGRERAEGNSPERNALRTRGRESTLSAHAPSGAATDLKSFISMSQP